MDWQERLAEQFEAERGQLRAVALRLLGSADEADDAVQETWLRLSRADTDAIENLGGWLRTVIGRVALDMLRARAARRIQPSAIEAVADLPDSDPAANPEHEAELGDAVGAALLVVLDRLSPAERLAFVMHDSFAIPFEEIGTALGRSPQSAKQLASRARAKVRGSAREATLHAQEKQAVVRAFLEASRNGDFEALVRLLHPGVSVRADEAAVRMGAAERTDGAAAVAAIFSGRAQGALLAWIDGEPGIAWLPGGTPRVCWELTIEDGLVVAMEMIAAAGELAARDIVPLAR